MLRRTAHAATPTVGGPAGPVLGPEAASTPQPPVPRAPRVPARGAARTPVRTHGTPRPVRPTAHRPAAPHPAVGRRTGTGPGVRR